MPLKYGLGILWPNKVLGMGHGLLTILFMGVLFITWKEKQLSSNASIGVFIASLIPFAAFIVDRQLKKKLRQSA